MALSLGNGESDINAKEGVSNTSFKKFSVNVRRANTNLEACRWLNKCDIPSPA